MVFSLKLSVGGQWSVVKLVSGHLLIPDLAKYVLVVARVADELPLEEGDVDDGGVEVDELEDEHFEGEIVVKLRLGPVHLWKGGNVTASRQYL